MRSICVVLLTLVTLTGYSQAGSVVERGSADTLAVVNPLKIQRIVVNPQDVFAENEVANSRLLRLLNRFHFATRKSVILRETLLRIGDEFDADLAYETERTLRDLPFIYEASVTIDSLDPEGVTLHIRTIDRWSLSAGLKVTRDSDRNLFRFGLTESNLLGLGHRAGATYTISKPDPSYADLEYRNPRVFGSFNEFEINIITNALDRTSRLTARRRFLHQSDDFSYSLTFRNFRRRDIDVTSFGDTAATFFQDGNRVEGGVSTRIGDYHRKLTASLQYRYIAGKINDLSVFNGYTFDGVSEIIPPALQTSPESFTIPKDSVLHEVLAFVTASRFDFYPVRRIKYQRRNEDLTIINGVRFGLGQGRDKALSEHLYSIWSATLFYGAQVSDLTFAGGTRRTGWVKGGRELRSTLNSSLIAYYNRIPWVTFAGRGIFGIDKRREDPNPLGVDGSTGVRGYPANFISGNKLLIGNLESRFFTGITALTTRLGFALHFDFGAAWSDSERFGLKRFIWSAGPGLRLDMGQIGTVRVDVSYLKALDSWEISASTGQFFDLDPGK